MKQFINVPFQFYSLVIFWANVGIFLNPVELPPSRPKLKGVMYVYLLGLALSNLCVLLTAIPALMDIAGDMDSRNSYAIAFFQVGSEMQIERLDLVTRSSNFY